MDASFKDRLARLRREAPPKADPKATEAPAPSTESPPAPELPSWWRARLATRANALNPPAPDALASPPSDLLEVSNERGAFAVREQRLPLAHRHGAFELATLRRIDAQRIALIAKDERLAQLDPARALLLDIETTGLSGGAGTKAFLVGLGWIEDAQLVLWQGFLRGPEEEAALLHAVAEHVERSDALVTFFGKTFDRHRLEDKMRVHGVKPPFESRAHLDLYHPLRALYRPALENARLGTFERVLCGVERQDDLSGAFAPEAWYDFLAGRPHRLERVFAHNRDDVLSLATLCAHLGSLELFPQLDAAADDSLRALESARLRGLARVLAHHKLWSECEGLARAAAELTRDEAQRCELEELIALAQRRASRSRRSR